MKQTVKTQSAKMVKALKSVGFNHIKVKSNHDGNSAYVKAYIFEDAEDIQRGVTYADHYVDVRISTHAPKAGGGFNAGAECGFGECDIQISTNETDLMTIANAAKNDGYKFNSKWADYDCSI